jgi:hypothetical protein
MKTDSTDIALSSLSEREQEVIAALRRIRFGALEVTVHDGKVVQIERKEKTRFAQ